MKWEPIIVEFWIDAIVSTCCVGAGVSGVGAGVAHGTSWPYASAPGWQSPSSQPSSGQLKSISSPS